MCMEDVKIGRSQNAGQFNRTVATASQMAVSCDYDRFALIFTAPVTGHVTYSLDNPAVLGNGINLGVGDGAVWLNVKDHGELVQREWQCISDQAGGVAIGILYSRFPKVQ